MHYQWCPPGRQNFGRGIVRQLLISGSRRAGRDRSQCSIVTVNCDLGEQIARDEVVRTALNDDLVITPRVERRISGRVQRTADELLDVRYVGDGVL